MRLLARLFGAKDRDDTPDGDMVSLVVLCASCPELSLDAVRSALDGVFPGQYLPKREEGNFVIDGPVPGATYAIQCSVPGACGFFLLHNVPAPYSECSDFANQFTGPLREQAIRQPCWMSVDKMGRHTTEQDEYRFIGRVLARLAPPDATVLLQPSTMAATAFSESVRRQLAAGDRPFEAAP